MSLHDVVSEPDLHEPVLVVGIEGWVDAGYGAAGAMAHLDEVLGPELIATFDVERLVDHRSRRPVMHLVEGVNTGLTWPHLELRHGRDTKGSDILLLTGAEPDVHWQEFAGEVVELAREMRVRLVVGMGAYPAPVPHTRPGRLATTATTRDLAALAGEVHATLDVPAGIAAAIEERCSQANLPAVGLWAQVPHYASAMAYPDASARLVEGLARLARLDIDSEVLRDAGTELRRRLDQLVADNPEHVAMVRGLEEVYDAEAGDQPTLRGPTGQVPSADELAAEVERFLREQGGEGRGGR